MYNYNDTENDLEDRSIIFGPEGLNGDPIDPTKIKKFDQAFKLGETKTGQLTFFPSIDADISRSKQDIENT